MPQYLIDRLGSIYRSNQSFFRRADGQNNVGVGVRRVEKNRDGTGGQSLLYANGRRHVDRDVGKPATAVEEQRLRVRGLSSR